MIAQRIENYRVEGEAARTVFGVACRAMDVERERAVRLTVLNPTLKQIPQFERRFVHAARKASVLDVSGASRVVGFGRTSDTLYIAREIIDGRALGARASRRLPPSVSLTLVARTAQVMDRIHASGVAHGLLTPASLFVSRGGGPPESNGARWRVAIADLGLPVLRADEMALVSGLSELILPFTAPEQVSRQAATASADLYSLGAILYYLLSGKAPLSPQAFSGEATDLRDQVAPIRDLRPDLSPELAGLVDKGVALEPAARFESGGQMARALELAAVNAERAVSDSEQARQKTASAAGGAARGSAPIAVSAANTAIELQPGETATLEITVENRGDVADHVTVKVEDLPRQWTTISQEFVRLTPGTSTALAVKIQPPRDSSATAGEHSFRVLVASTDQQPEPVTIEGRLTVQPFSQIRVDVAPLILEHGSAANVTLKNEGNAPETLTIKGHDPGDALHFSSEHDELTVAAGSTRTIPLRISARRQPALGATQVTPFSVIVAGDADVREERTGELHIPPAVPRWLAMVMAGLLIVAATAGIIALSPLGEDAGEEAPGAVMVSPTATATVAPTATSAAQVEPAALDETEAAALAGAGRNDEGDATEALTEAEAPVTAGIDEEPPPETPEAEEENEEAPAPGISVESSPTRSNDPASATPDAAATIGSGELIAFEVAGEPGTREVLLMTSNGLEERTLASGASSPVW
ncbi:MAG TPA: NEW3 domain-containing protein, partial [Candidatus Sulfomarinibacteraceae bacterium]|nr:NEW3 domain-containing protein [Candidatus Sulfomarinibacteraceae bacterium]